MLTLTLTILKYGLMAVGGGLGIHGVLNDYKADGRLTPEGRRAIKLMIVVGILTVVAAGLEQYAAHLEYQEKVTQERLGHPLKDLTLEFSISTPQADAFADELRPAGSRPDADNSMLYIGTAFKNGGLEVTKTITGWQLEMSLERPLGSLLRRFGQETPEWKAFERGIQRALGSRFEMSLAKGGSVLDLAGATWPMRLRIINSTFSFQVVDPHLSPLDLKNSGIVFSHRGLFRPSEMRLTSSDPRIVLDQKWPLSWQKQAYREVSDPGGDPVPLYEYVTAPLQVDPATLKPREKETPAK